MSSDGLPGDVETSSNPPDSLPHAPLHFNDFPPELHGCIFNFLNQKDCFSVSLVSHLYLERIRALRRDSWHHEVCLRHVEPSVCGDDFRVGATLNAVQTAVSTLSRSISVPYNSRRIHLSRKIVSLALDVDYCRAFLLTADNTHYTYDISVGADVLIHTHTHWSSKPSFHATLCLSYSTPDHTTFYVQPRPSTLTGFFGCCHREKSYRALFSSPLVTNRPFATYHFFAGGRFILTLSNSKFLSSYHSGTRAYLYICDEKRLLPRRLDVGTSRSLFILSLLCTGSYCFFIETARPDRPCRLWQRNVYTGTLTSLASLGGSKDLGYGLSIFPTDKLDTYVYKRNGLAVTNTHFHQSDTTFMQVFLGTLTFGTEWTPLHRFRIPDTPVPVRNSGPNSYYIPCRGGYCYVTENPHALTFVDVLSPREVLHPYLVDVDAEDDSHSDDQSDYEQYGSSEEDDIQELVDDGDRTRHAPYPFMRE